MRSLAAFVFLSLFLSVTSVFAAPVDMKPAARQILELFRNHDVVMLGEIHHVHEQRALLTAIAQENGKARTIDALATEAITTADQEKIDRYQATGDEADLFVDEGWFNSVNIREAFRQFRTNREKICAVDVDFYWPNNPKRAPELRERFLSFPPEVQKLILKHAGVRDLAGLIKSETFFDREYLMGAAIAACLARHRKVLVHLGADHISSLDPVFLRQTKNEAWDTTQWVTHLRPDVRWVAVKNMIEVPEDLDAAGKALVALHKAKGARVPFLMPSKDLPASIRKLMASEGTEIWRRADYVIVGPSGTPEKKVKPVN